MWDLKAEHIPATAVFGAAGFLGRRLTAQLAELGGLGAAYTRTGQDNTRKLDLELLAPRGATEAAAELALGLAHEGCRAAVLCLGVTSLAACEADPARTSRINVQGTLTLARALADAGLRVLYTSSDAVFSGESAEPYTEYDEPDPVNEYGRQKAEVEAGLEELGEAALVVRLPKLYGLTPGDGSLLHAMAAALMAGEEVLAAHDLIFQPTWVRDAARGLLLALSQPCPDPWLPLHLCQPMALSRFELASSLARRLPRPTGTVRAVALAELGLPMRLPGNLRLQASDCFADLAYLSTDLALDTVAEAYK